MKKQIIFSSVLVVGFLLGASALTALADWTAPHQSPPNCDTNPADTSTYDAGCVAPINVGTALQSKNGALTLQGLSVFSSGFYFNPGGGTVTPGYVLTAQNGTGQIGWQAPGAQSISYYAKDVTGSSDGFFPEIAPCHSGDYAVGGSALTSAGYVVAGSQPYPTPSSTNGDQTIPTGWSSFRNGNNVVYVVCAHATQ